MLREKVNATNFASRKPRVHGALWISSAVAGENKSDSMPWLNRLASALNQTTDGLLKQCMDVVKVEVSNARESMNRFEQMVSHLAQEGVAHDVHTCAVTLSEMLKKEIRAYCMG